MCTSAHGCWSNGWRRCNFPPSLSRASWCWMRAVDPAEGHNPFKFVITNAIRFLFRRLPEEHRYKLCGRLIIKNWALWLLLSHCLICIRYPERADSLDISTIQLGLYDAYSPFYNHLHTR